MVKMLKKLVVSNSPGYQLSASISFNMEIFCFFNVSCGGFINFFSRSMTGFQRHAKRFELNFVIGKFRVDEQTKWTKSSS